MTEQTRILHSIPVDELTGAIAVPIYQTSTFVQEAPGVHKGFDYARTNNPTRKVLEDLIATLEHGAQGVAFSSGLAAIDAVVKLLQSGDEIVAVDDIYGGAYRLFSSVYAKFGITVRYVDATDVRNIQDALSARTKLIWIESPTNPTLKISDIEAIAEIATSHGCLLCVDNTFASPFAQNPIALGADLVIHSATKYLSGHSDLIAGLVVAKSRELGERIKYIQNASGAVLGAFDCFLCIRGIETLAVRMEQHARSAQAVADFLVSHPQVRTVYYPGLSTHQNHLVASRQQRSYGGVVSFDLHDDQSDLARRVVCSTRLFKLAESLGGVKSLICLPCEMTHKSIPAHTRRANGLSDSLIRLSVGLESAEDLIDDLEQALDSALSLRSTREEIAYA